MVHLPGAEHRVWVWITWSWTETALLVPVVRGIERQAEAEAEEATHNKADGERSDGVQANTLILPSGAKCAFVTRHTLVPGALGSKETPVAERAT